MTTAPMAAAAVAMINSLDSLVQSGGEGRKAGRRARNKTKSINDRDEDDFHCNRNKSDKRKEIEDLARARATDVNHGWWMKIAT
jgi:hypothetical protein